MNKKKLIFGVMILLVLATFILELLRVIPSIWCTLIRYIVFTVGITYGFWKLGEFVQKRTGNNILGSFIKVFPSLTMIMAVISAIVHLISE